MSTPPDHPPYSNPETERTRQSIFDLIRKITQALAETWIERHERLLKEKEHEQL